MHRDWIILLAALLCTPGCILDGGPEKSLTSLGSANAEGQFSANGIAQGFPASKPATTNWWSTSWKTNPLTSWINQGNVIPASLQSASEQEQPTTIVDTLSLDFNTTPENAKLYVSMAEICDKGGNAQQAREFYQKALFLEPDYLPALMGMARFEDRQGRLDQAIQIYQKAITAHPKSPTALNDLAICYARNNQLQVSLELLEQAIELQPTKPIYRNNIAKVLTELNQQEASLIHLATVHSPAVAYYNQGVLLAQRGRLEEATTSLSQAIAIDSGLQPAHALLEKMNPASPLQMASRPRNVRYSLDSVSPLVPGSDAKYPVGDAPLTLPPIP